MGSLFGRAAILAFMAGCIIPTSWSMLFLQLRYHLAYESNKLQFKKIVHLGRQLRKELKNSLLV